MCIRDRFISSLGAGSPPPAPEVEPVVYEPDPTPILLQDEPSPRRIAATQKAYARMDTGVLMLIPQLAFATDHDVL